MSGERRERAWRDRWLSPCRASGLERGFSCAPSKVLLLPPAVCVRHMSSVRDRGTVGTRGHARCDPVQPCRPQSVSGQSRRPCPEPGMLGPRGQLCGCGSCWGAGKMGAVLGVHSLLFLMRPQGPQAPAGCSRSHPPTGRLWGTVETGEQVRLVCCRRSWLAALGCLALRAAGGPSTFLPSLASAQGASGPRRSRHAVSPDVRCLAWS